MRNRVMSNNYNDTFTLVGLHKRAVQKFFVNGQVAFIGIAMRQQRRVNADEIDAIKPRRRAKERTIPVQRINAREVAKRLKAIRGAQGGAMPEEYVLGRCGFDQKGASRPP